MADYSRPDTGIVNAQHIHTSLVGNPNLVYATDTSNVIDKRPVRLESVDLTSYSEGELRGFAGLLEVYLNEKYPPKPPKFDSIEEADAWMEKHYGK